MGDGQNLLVEFTEKVHGGVHLLHQTWANKANKANNNTPDQKPKETSPVSFWMVRTNALILARRTDSSKLFQHISAYFSYLCQGTHICNFGDWRRGSLCALQQLKMSGLH